MACQLLHIIEQPDPAAYADADLKDVVGAFPRFFCANCDPLAPLKPSEAVRCLDREGPCWKPADRTCG